MIFVYAPRKWKTIAQPTYRTELQTKLAHDLEQISMISGTFKLSPDFIESYEAWYEKQDDHPPFDDDRLAGYLERRPNHVLKLSMILGASESNGLALYRHHFERALKILTDAEKDMLQVFRGIGKSSIAALVARMQAIVATKMEVEYAELVNRFLHDADNWHIDQALKQMEAAKMVKTIHEGSRVTVRWVGGDINRFYQGLGGM
jgi:hypothetical protein